MPDPRLAARALGRLPLYPEFGALPSDGAQYARSITKGPTMLEAITTRTVTMPSGMSVFQVFPEGRGPWPCFVVLHERYGLVQHTMNLSSRIASLGYVVVAPDLYFDYEDQEGLRNSTASTRISDVTALERIDDALKTLSGIPSADPSRLGMLGACATGRFPVVWGANRHLDACVVIHGLYRVREWTFDPALYLERCRDGSAPHRRLPWPVR